MSGEALAEDTDKVSEASIDNGDVVDAAVTAVADNTAATDSANAGEGDAALAASTGTRAADAEASDSPAMGDSAGREAVPAAEAVSDAKATEAAAPIEAPAAAADTPVADASAEAPADAAADVPMGTENSDASTEIVRATAESAEAAPVEMAGDTADGADVADADMVDMVPFVRYDDEDERSLFSKDGRWIVPQNPAFPSIFCALRVRVRLEVSNEAAGGYDEDAANMANLKHEAILQILRDDLGFGKTLIRWDDVRSGTTGDGIQAREIVLAVNGSLPEGKDTGSVVKSEEWDVDATIVDVTETCDDMDHVRITDLARNLKDGSGSDAILLELPQLWIIPDPDFRSKAQSIGLYPGSYWMAFLKSWGLLETAEIFFRTVQPQAHQKSKEALVHLVVKFKDRAHLRMCSWNFKSPISYTLWRKKWGGMVARLS